MQLPKHMLDTIDPIVDSDNDSTTSSGKRRKLTETGSTLAEDFENTNSGSESRQECKFRDKSYGTLKQLGELIHDCHDQAGTVKSNTGLLLSILDATKTI
ncbi:hypothetical protein BGZ76_006153 [Entomortierella beljakovae]|nr:hypothetical protein BGZ76_006153 [Entomortierella beljakovae]